jgi:hypothetical protein
VHGDRDDRPSPAPVQPVPAPILRRLESCAACGHCNYRGGREIQLANRTDRQLLNHYEQIIERQRVELDELNRRLAECERGEAKRRPVPRNY